MDFWTLIIQLAIEGSGNVLKEKAEYDRTKRGKNRSKRKKTRGTLKL